MDTILRQKRLDGRRTNIRIDKELDSEIIKILESDPTIESYAQCMRVLMHRGIKATKEAGRK